MNMRSLYLLALAAGVGLGAVSVPIRAETYLVDDDGPAKFRTIQSAVDAARDGDVIIVNPGTYSGSGNRDIDLTGKGITIVGADPYDPVIVESTVIDAGGGGTLARRALIITDCNGVEIAGLTLMNDFAPMGGAVYCRNSALTLDHCRIVDSATQAGDPKAGLDGGLGGGIYAEGSDVELVACLVSGNSTEGEGGGIYAINSDVTLIGSTVTENTAGRGGGIYADLVTIVNSAVTHNVVGVGGSGGGIYAETAAIDATRIEGNRAGAMGGGLYCAVLDLTNSLVAGNRAGGDPGQSGSGADGVGGGLWCTGGLIRHCTIADNVADIKSADPKGQGPVGGGVFCDTRTTLSNAILYGNAPDQLAGHDCSNVTYCDIEGSACAGRPGNLSAAPQFIRPGGWVHRDDANAAVTPDDQNARWLAGDYGLLDGSPCIDAGDPDFAPVVGEVDLDGRSRVVGGTVDMGAFEAQTLLPVYRFWSVTTGKHFYTLDELEKNTIIDLYPHVWVFEGIAYYAYARASEPGLAPVYRFWSPVLGGHFYTIDEAEKDFLLDNYPDVWIPEGSVFYAYPDGEQPDGAKMVHRFWSDSLGAHFYTINEAEKDLLIREFAFTWTYEGAAWYAFEKPLAPEPPATPDPKVYQFTGGQEDALFVLQLRAAIDNKEAKLDNPDIGFVPEVGRMAMQVDLGGMTARLDEFSIDSVPVEHDAVISGGEIGRAELPITLSLQGLFDSPAVRGPYDVDVESLVFPVGQPEEAVDPGDLFRLVGSMTIDGRKLSIDLTLAADEFDLNGKGRFDAENAPDHLDVQMAGPFTWERRQENLLIETRVKERTVQLYVTYLRLQTMGLWEGRPAQEDGKK
jgi:predicted outer membrane repeat protein